MASGTIINYREDSGWVYPLSEVTAIRYRKVAGIVYVIVANWEYPTDWDGNTIFTLPSGYRPAESTNVIMRRHNDNLVANAWIGTGGTFNITATNKGVSLSTVVIYPIG